MAIMKRLNKTEKADIPREFTIEELKQMRDSIKVCELIGFCTEVYPSKAELRQILDELIEYKVEDDGIVDVCNKWMVKQPVTEYALGFNTALADLIGFIDRRAD